MIDIELLSHVKKLVIIALVSDDELMETLVLKGGNAIEFVYRPGTDGVSRASFDIDFSIEEDFFELEAVKERIYTTLFNTFQENEYYLFDYKFHEKPKVIREDIKDFWGGYYIEFKIISREEYNKLDRDIEAIRRNAIPLNNRNSPKFEIEISKYEYVDQRIQTSLEGYVIYVYSPEMVVFEKLRALCQQIPEYKTIIPSQKSRPRARDFYDIHLIMEDHKINPGNSENLELIKNIFLAKKVPLEFVKLLKDYKYIHVDDWQNVEATVSAKDELLEFDFYFKYVIDNFESLTFP